MKGTPAGVTFGDGTFAPMPGIYVLNTDGRVTRKVAVSSGDSKEELLKALRQ